MSTKFSVIRFVPDVVADERVNIGVVVVDERLRYARCAFVRNWSRASKIANGDASFLSQVASAFEAACSLMTDTDSSPLSILNNGLQTLSENWDNGIQLSTPKSVLMDADLAVKFLAERYLTQPERKMPVPARTKLQAVSKARRSLEKALANLSFTSEHKVVTRKDAVVKGNKTLQQFDYGVRNGVMRIGGFGLSFETGTDDEIALKINAIGFAALDIREANPTLPIGVVAIGDQRKRRGVWARFDESLGDIGVDLLRENQIDEWSEEKVFELAGAH